MCMLCTMDDSSSAHGYPERRWGLDTLFFVVQTNLYEWSRQDSSQLSDMDTLDSSGISLCYAVPPRTLGLACSSATSLSLATVSGGHLVGIEIPGSVLLLSPATVIRRTGAVLQILLQVVILATGNYNFFNLLTIVLCLVCFINDNSTMAPSKRTAR